MYEDEIIPPARPVKPAGAAPEISVIIPTYQHAAELPRCLESVFRQTFTDFEVVIVNDGSTDDTDARVRPFEDRVQYVKQENKGGNNARNRGFALSRGKFVIFCDADVLMQPDMLDRMRGALLIHEDASYAYSSFKFGWKKFILWPFNPDKLREMNYIHTTSLIRREHFPGFDETIKRLQDWDLWLTMLERKKYGYWIDDILFQCLPHKGGISLWVPGIFYKIPWKRFGVHITTVEKFKEARAVMVRKHKLPVA